MSHPCLEPSLGGGRLIGQGSYVLDDDFTVGSFRNTSSGPDSLILRVERDEDALDPLDRDGPVVPALHDVNVTVSHARAVPARSAVQTPPECGNPRARNEQQF